MPGAAAQHQHRHSLRHYLPSLPTVQIRAPYVRFNSKNVEFNGKIPLLMAKPTH